MTRHSTARAIYDLLSSMRFAVSLLTILAIASVVGTVLKQAEPYANYISQFGPFWFPVFEALGLYDVYHAAWFLAILGFLVLSTSLCIFRNGPAMRKTSSAPIQPLRYAISSGQAILSPWRCSIV